MMPIINVGRNAWQKVHADRGGLLVDAADYYYAVYRAISGARSYVLMSGWQFDSGVQLLRGADVPAGVDVRFLKFLDHLCRDRPELRVYLIAWDFNMVFAGEREWFQRVYFHWMTKSVELAGYVRLHGRNPKNALGAFDPEAQRQRQHDYLYTEAEIAEALGVTDRTVRRDWEKARLLLAQALAP